MSYSSEILADNPVGYWRLQETSGTTVADSGPNALNGSYANTPTLGVAGPLVGVVSRAVSFDRSQGENASVPDAAPLDTGDVVTVEAWVKRNAILNAVEWWATKGSDSWIVAFTSENRLLWRKASVGNIVTSTVQITDLDFHHVVFTKNASTNSIYVDGVDRTGSVNNRTLTNNSTRLYWASDMTGNIPGGYANVTLAECALYKTALSAARVKAHYDAGVASLNLVDLVGMVGI